MDCLTPLCVGWGTNEICSHKMYIACNHSTFFIDWYYNSGTSQMQTQLGPLMRPREVSIERDSTVHIYRY